MKRQSLGICLLLLMTVTACDSMPSWLGGRDDDDKPKLPGTRIDVLSNASVLKPDESLVDIGVIIPEQKTNENWRQAGGSPQGMTGNLQFPEFKHTDRTRIGDGNIWEQPLYTSPVVANNMVFAMDSRGYVTAHDPAKIDKIKWTNKSAVGEDEPDVLGGGLAFDNGHLYITTGRGKIFAVNAEDGKEIWQQFLGVPLRAAPKAGDGRVYAVSVDNQLFALDAEKGTQLWSHRGINENAGFLASISPAVSQYIIIAPYSSGEIHALDSASGQNLWNDSLLKPRRNNATFGFSGIGGNPVISDDVVYAVDSNGLTAAFALQSGRRLWEQEISSLNTPWIAGDFIYMISTESQAVCLYRGDGRIKWVQQLPRYEDKKKHRLPYTWFGPVLASDKLLVAGAHGQMMLLSPKDGTTLSTVDIPENITNAPVIAGGRMYFVTSDARLHVIY